MLPLKVVSVTNFFFFRIFWTLPDLENLGSILWIKPWLKRLLQSRFEPCSCTGILWKPLKAVAGCLCYLSLGRSRVEPRSAPQSWAARELYWKAAAVLCGLHSQGAFSLPAQTAGGVKAAQPCVGDPELCNKLHTVLKGTGSSQNQIPGRHIPLDVNHSPALSTTAVLPLFCPLPSLVAPWACENPQQSLHRFVTLVLPLNGATKQPWHAQRYTFAHVQN